MLYNIFYDFSFSDLYQFLLTALGMILSYSAGRLYKPKGKCNKKSRPHV